MCLCRSFFHYMHYTDEAGFATVQQQQKLMIDFPDYASVSYTPSSLFRTVRLHDDGVLGRC